MAESSLGTNQY